MTKKWWQQQLGDTPQQLKEKHAVRMRMITKEVYETASEEFNTEIEDVVENFRQRFKEQKGISIPFNVYYAIMRGWSFAAIPPSENGTI